MEKVFLPIPAQRFVYPGHQMEVTKMHLDALEREHIAFGYICGSNSKPIKAGEKRPINPEALEPYAVPEIRVPIDMETIFKRDKYRSNG
jgi:hypothetical protein